MRKERKNYTAEEKVAIRKRHLVEKEPIWSLCDELALQPTVFHRWQKEFFENGAAAFQTKAPPNHQAEQERIDYLEKKIQTKAEDLAELMVEHVALKKALGKSDRGLRTARRAGSDRGFSSGAGRRRRRSAPGASLFGSKGRQAISTRGGNAMAASMSTMVGFPAISG